MVGLLKTYTFAAGTAGNTAAITDLATFIGGGGRLLGVIFTMTLATDTAQLVIYIQAAGINVPVLTMGTSFTLLGNSLSGSQMYWLGTDRGFAGLNSKANSIENFVFEESTPTAGDTEGCWPIFMPASVLSSAAGAALTQGPMGITLVQANVGVTTLIYTDDTDRTADSVV